jgi:RNA polymerase sigma-70 factor (ECF subfamily)
MTQLASASELLDRLGRGDASATRDLLLAYSSYLRVVVRRTLSARLRPGCDSSDVLQSVWVQVARSLKAKGWKVENERQLRGLLAVIARRGVTKRARSQSRLETDPEAGSQLDALPIQNQPRPSEAAVGEELWQRMLDRCPPQHHRVLELRRCGLPLAEVAAQTGLHEGSVRRIIRQLARELAFQQSPAKG